MKKIVSIVGGLIAVVIIAVVAFVFLFAGDAIKVAVEEMGPKLTKSDVKLDNISVKIDTSTIGKDTIVIKEIIINAPDVIAEFKKFSFNPLKASASIQQSLKTSNFIAIQKNVEAFVQ